MKISAESDTYSCEFAAMFFFRKYYLRLKKLRFLGKTLSFQFKKNLLYSIFTKLIIYNIKTTLKYKYNQNISSLIYIAWNTYTCIVYKYYKSFTQLLCET